MLRPLPVPQPERLVMLDTPGPFRGMTLGNRMMSNVLYRELCERNEAFAGLLARYPMEFSLSGEGQPERLFGELVSGNYFEVLGVEPAAGRLLNARDDVRAGGHPLVVLSHGFWRRKFGGAAGVVGRTIRINGQPLEVIGVAARGFQGVEAGGAPDVFIPLAMKALMTPIYDGMQERFARFLHVIGRLKPGVEPAQARAQLNVLYKPLLETDLKLARNPPTKNFQDRYRKKQIELLPAAGGVPGVREEYGTPLRVLMAMVGLTLLIACANVANLLLARAAARQKEIAVRLSLGADRWALLRQLLVESVVLGLAGGVAALLVAWWTTDVLIQLLPGETLTRALSGSWDWRLLGFHFGVSLLAGVLFGLAPAWQASRPRLAEVLKDQAAAVVGSALSLASRKGLVMAQVALSLLLLIGAGLFLRSLVNLRAIDPGFRTENLAVFSTDASQSGYGFERIRQAYRQLERRLAAEPGVAGVSVADQLMLADNRWMMTVKVEGYQSKEGEDMNSLFMAVGPGFLKHLGMQLVAGRDIEEADGEGTRRVGLVNESFARYFFGSAGAVGRRFGYGEGPPGIEIVGVYRDNRHVAMRQAPQRAIIMPLYRDRDLSGATFYVRTRRAPEPMLAALRRAAMQADPNLALYDLRTMEAQMGRSLFVDRMVAFLCACFGALATLLAGVGLYGVTAYSVSRRTREIGVRMALGCTERRVLAIVLREVSWMLCGGILIGLPLALWLSRLVEQLLYGLRPNDGWTVAAATALLLLIALLAAWLPARRACRIDPLIALRYE